MKKNMGNADRLLRVLLSVVLVVLYATGMVEGTLAWVLVGVAGIFTLTSLVSFCPLYTLVGFSTCSTSKGGK